MRGVNKRGSLSDGNIKSRTENKKRRKKRKERKIARERERE